MKIVKTLSLVLIFMALDARFIAAGFEDKYRGTAALPFLKVVAGAEQSALGQTGMTSAGAESIFLNPANIGKNRKTEIFINHSLMLEETAVSFLSMTWPSARRGGFGGALQYFDAGRITQTDAIGQSVGSFTPRDFSLSGGFSMPWRRFRMGVTGKYIQSKIIHTASVNSFDAGILYEPDENISFGGVYQNIIGKIEYVNEESPLPRVIRLGGAWRASLRWTIFMEEVLDKSQDPYVALGAQYLLSENKIFKTFARFGLNQALQRDKDGLAGVTGGGGISFQKFDLDYAWVPGGDLGQTHIFSMNYRWK